MDGRLNDVWLSGNDAYLALATGGLQIIDVAEPRSPRLVGTFITPDSPRTIHVSGKLACIAGEGTFHILDVNDPSTPRRLGEYRASGIIQRIQIEGNLVYLANDRTGFQVVDISNPISPIRIGSSAANVALTDLQIVGQRAYLTDAENGLRILDLSFRIPQVLDFGLPPVAILIQSPLTLTATANSGLPVSYSVINGVATVDENKLLLGAPGTVTIRAEQPGDDQFLSATIERSVRVSASDPPRIRDVSFGPTGDIRLHVLASQKQTLLLEFSSDLKSWISVTTTTVTSNSDGFTVSAPLLFRPAFYRVRVLREEP
jgi:hypothetical protein